MAGVVKRLRPRIVVPICMGSNPITRPITMKITIRVAINIATLLLNLKPNIFMI